MPGWTQLKVHTESILAYNGFWIETLSIQTSCYVAFLWLYFPLCWKHDSTSHDWLHSDQVNACSTCSTGRAGRGKNILHLFYSSSTWSLFAHFLWASIRAPSLPFGYQQPVPCRGTSLSPAPLISAVGGRVGVWGGLNVCLCAPTESFDSVCDRRVWHPGLWWRPENVAPLSELEWGWGNEDVSVCLFLIWAGFTCLPAWHGRTADIPLFS